MVSVSLTMPVMVNYEKCHGVSIFEKANHGKTREIQICQCLWDLTEIVTNAQ